MRLSLKFFMIVSTFSAIHFVEFTLSLRFCNYCHHINCHLKYNLSIHLPKHLSAETSHLEYNYNEKKADIQTSNHTNVHTDTTLPRVAKQTPSMMANMVTELVEVEKSTENQTTNRAN